jgi:hypothetical protein
MTADRRKSIAAIVTEYRYHAHADLLIGKILEGYDQLGGPGPDLRVLSMYVDQFPTKDMSRALARKYGFTLHDNVAGALCNGGKELAVEGVLIIGEHGTYPMNARGQILYPRRKWFEETVAVFERSKRVVPVFNDKHLGIGWADAKVMVEKARELGIALMAGSVIPLTWRRPDVNLPRDAEIREALAIGYGPIEGYGFHALEMLQSMVERRKGGETGVKSVQCLQGEAMWKALDAGRWSAELFDAARKLIERHAPGDIRQITAKAADAALWLIDYRDGLRAAIPMPNGWIYEGDGGAFYFATRVQGQPRPIATQFYQQLDDPFGHFDYQVRAIESLVRTGHSPVPVERTLLTTGMLEALLISQAENHRVVETPHLAVKYQATDWPHATGPVPKKVQRRL